MLWFYIKTLLQDFLTVTVYIHYEQTANELLSSQNVNGLLAKIMTTFWWVLIDFIYSTFFYQNESLKKHFSNIF